MHDRRGEGFERVSRTLLAQIITADDSTEENVFDLADLNASPSSPAHHYHHAAAHSPFAYAASTALSAAPVSPSRGNDASSAYSAVDAYAPHEKAVSTYAAHYQHGMNAASSVSASSSSARAPSSASSYAALDRLEHQATPPKYKHMGAAARAAESRAQAPHEPDFLLCDVRTEEEYNACHIRAGALNCNFPLESRYHTHSWFYEFSLVCC